MLKPGGTLTVAHGMSREKIDAHHHGTARHVSNGLMPAEELAEILYKIPEDIIRVKGYVLGQNDTTIYFNYVLNEFNIFEGSKKDKALVSIIGTEIDEALFKELFHD